MTGKHQIITNINELLLSFKRWKVAFTISAERTRRITLS
jgi:hypothetical protein